MKKRHSTIYRLAVCGVTLLLATACTQTNSPNDAANNSNVITTTSKNMALSAYVGENICDILPKAVLEEQFGATDALTSESTTGRYSSKCNYSWPRPDAEERKQAMVDQMIKNVQRKDGEKIKLNVRAMTSDFSIGVDLKESKSSAANFVPVKLSEEELQKKIAQANEAANKRLTDKQKEVLGKNGAGDMVSGLLRKANERVEVEGVGEAAYWLPMMGGSLSVLAGGYQLTISPMLADDEAGNIEAARKVAMAILR